MIRFPNHLRCRRALVRISAVCLVLFACVSALSQSKQTYQTGTIMEVKLHQPAAENDSSGKQYDITVKVGSTLYVVLYTAPAGSNMVEYRTGIDTPVSIQGDMMKFSDLLGRNQSVPIVSRKPIQSKKAKEAPAKTPN